MNLQVTRYPMFLPSLKILKIHLEQHDAIDFLRNLDEKFCKKIEELSLNVHNDQKLNHANEITSILSKFESLKSLNLSTTSADFDAKCLFSICQKLKDLRIQRYNSGAASSK